MPKVETVLKQRQKTHGEFTEHARVSQALKQLCTREDYSDVQREGLSMILHKIARIVNGNPNHDDHWVDIAGYATLVANSLKEKNK